MPDISRLLNGGLAALLGNGNPNATEDALYQRMAGDIDRTSGDAARAINENTFGRGLGLSTISRDMQADRERIRGDALGKARKDAFLASQQATLAALAQAASSDARAQQNSQFQQNLGFQNKALSAQQGIANNQMLAQGGGALGGALMQLGGKAFGPEITTGLRGLFGLGGKPGIEGGAASTPFAHAGTPGAEIGTDYTPPDFSSTVQDLPMPDMSGLDIDLSGLDSLMGFDPFTYDPPYTYDYWGQ